MKHWSLTNNYDLDMFSLNRVGCETLDVNMTLAR